MKLVRNNKGFTLVELLTVALILVIISTVIAGMIASTLRGTGQSKIVNIVSQNGNFALSQATNIIVGSESVHEVIITDNADPTLVVSSDDCTTNPVGTGIVLKRNDGGLTKLSCKEISNLGGNERLYSIASESANLSGGYVVPVATSKVVLMDDSTTELYSDGTSANACSFSCYQSNPFEPPTIEINFTIKPKSDPPSASGEPKLPYSTKVLMRNFRNR